MRLNWLVFYRRRAKASPVKAIMKREGLERNIIVDNGYAGLMVGYFFKRVAFGLQFDLFS